jgi:hypothetical protein
MLTILNEESGPIEVLKICIVQGRAVVEIGQREGRSPRLERLTFGLLEDAISYAAHQEVIPLLMRHELLAQVALHQAMMFDTYDPLRF